MGRKLGDPEYPLLVSVRSGARFSMPGMMETVLNIGLNDARSVAGLARTAGDDRFAWDSYRRLIHVRQDRARSRRRLVRACTRPDERQRRRRDGRRTSRRFAAATGRRLQVGTTARAPSTSSLRIRTSNSISRSSVFQSWNTDRARLYRAASASRTRSARPSTCRQRGKGSGTGVAFTADPSSGASGVYGDYLPEQGEDVVAGILPWQQTNSTLQATHGDHAPVATARPRPVRHRVHHRAGKRRMLQTRVGKRTAAAAYRIAVQLVHRRGRSRWTRPCFASQDTSSAR